MIPGVWLLIFSWTAWHALRTRLIRTRRLGLSCLEELAWLGMPSEVRSAKGIPPLGMAVCPNSPRALCCRTAPRRLRSIGRRAYWESGTWGELPQIRAEGAPRAQDSSPDRQFGLIAVWGCFRSSQAICVRNWGVQFWRCSFLLVWRRAMSKKKGGTCGSLLLGDGIS